MKSKLVLILFALFLSVNSKSIAAAGILGEGDTGLATYKIIVNEDQSVISVNAHNKSDTRLFVKVTIDYSTVEVNDSTTTKTCAFEGFVDSRESKDLVGVAMGHDVKLVKILEHSANPK